MSMFTLTISFLTTSNLPWIIDLVFQFPVEYCSLQHQALLPFPVISTTGHFFWFGYISSFFLELFVHSSPVSYWAPNGLVNSSFSVISFCLIILFMGFSRQEYWSRFSIPFCSGPCLVRTLCYDLSTLCGPTQHGCSFIELDKAVVHVISLISFLWLWYIYTYEIESESCSVQSKSLQCHRL